MFSIACWFDADGKIRRFIAYSLSKDKPYDKGIINFVFLKMNSSIF